MAAANGTDNEARHRTTSSALSSWRRCLTLATMTVKANEASII
jgi:hypothetical protein